MGLSSVAEALNEEAARDHPRALATLGVAGCLSAAAGDETPGAESWVACSLAASIRVDASDGFTRTAHGRTRHALKSWNEVVKTTSAPFPQSEQTVVILLTINQITHYID